MKTIFINLIVLNIVILVSCDDLLKVEIPKISLDDSTTKNHKVSSQKHIISGGGNIKATNKVGNAEKASNYEKDRGFYFMKAYGWDREKKNEHLNAQGKLSKINKGGNILKAGADYNKKLSEYEKDSDDKKNDYHNVGLVKRVGSIKPFYNLNQEHKLMYPQIDYKENPVKNDYYNQRNDYKQNKIYSNPNYPNTYGPKFNFGNTFGSHIRYQPKKQVWKQNYPYQAIGNHNNYDNNLVKYHGDNYDTDYKKNYLNDHSESPYNLDENINEDDEEGRHYYAKPMSPSELEKLRLSYSKFDNGYEGSHPIPQTEFSEIPFKKTENKRKLFIGSHYY